MNVRLLSLKDINKTDTGNSVLAVPYRQRLLPISNIGEPKPHKVWGRVSSLFLGNNKLYLPSVAGIFVLPRKTFFELSEYTVLRESRYTADLLLADYKDNIDIGTTLKSPEGYEIGKVVYIGTIGADDDDPYGEVWCLTQQPKGWHVPYNTYNTVQL